MNRGLVLGLAVALITSGCSGDSDSAELQALREKVEALEAQTTSAAPTTAALLGSIALGSEGNIFVMNPDGTDVRQLTDNNRTKVKLDSLALGLPFSSVR